MTVLSPGANAPLPAGDLTVLIRHGTIQGAEIDLSAFLVTGTGKVRSDADMCFYGQPSVAGGAVALAGASGGETRFSVAPGRIPAGVEKVILTATIHENRGTFGQLSEMEFQVGGVTGKIPCSGMTETALILAEVYQRNGAWKVRAVGQGFNGGLAALATHLGVDIAEPVPEPAPTPAPAAQAAPPSTVNLSKVSLTKQNSTVNLKKDDGRFGKIRVNLNWNQKTQKIGLFSFGSSNIDLDLGAFVEMRNGNRSVVQALGNAFGGFETPPFVKLLGDDRTGALTDGEWLEINGDKWPEIERILIYAFIYEGVPNWQQTDGVVKIFVPGQPEVEVRMNEFGDKRGMCAVASLENNAGQVRVSREVTFHNGHKEMDSSYGWGFRWKAGSK
jgi:tellurite resistance protein TerA